jgi:aspartate/methionine/tyrosine aminotransferase
MAAVQAPIIPIVGELIRAHPGTISLGQGVVYYGPPDSAWRRIQDFFPGTENHRYGPVQGDPRLLDLITRKLQDENGIACDDRHRVVVTAGGNMGFLNALFAIADPGDEIILPVPYYFNQEMAIRMLNCTPVLVPTDRNYQLRTDCIEQAVTGKTRAIVTISPNNPTGAVYPEAALREVNRICRTHSLYHISDEAYENFTYGGARHFSPGSIEGAHEHTISLYSLSKAYGFASWRIGYMVVPAHLFESVLKAQDTNLICAPLISQHAAIGALETGSRYCLEKSRTIAEVRGIVLSELQGLGALCTAPPADGAFYVLLKVDTDMAPMKLVERLITEHGVAVIPGTAFGLHDGCYLRVSYGALERETAVEGMRRLESGLKAIVNK